MLPLLQEQVMKHSGPIVVFMVLIFICGCSMISNEQLPESVDHFTTDPQHVVSIFPTSPAQITQRAQLAENKAQQKIEAILAIPDDQRTFANTVAAYDQAAGEFTIYASSIAFLFNITPDKSIRTSAEQTAQAMKKFGVEVFSQNQPLYQAIKGYSDNRMSNENLTPEQTYYIQELLEEFEQAGLNLPDDIRQKIRKLLNELSSLAMTFSKNLNNNTRSIVVTQEQLDGVDEKMLNQFERTEDGKFIVTTQYSDYFPVINHCTISATREKLYLEFLNRAYPENLPVLESLIKKRDKLAHLLGFESYTKLALANQMVTSPEHAQQFVQQIIEKAKAPLQTQIEKITEDLPPGITVTQDNKLEPWDSPFVQTEYAKKHFDIDERKIAEYFPMQPTLDGMISIYQMFFDLTIKEIPVTGLWHDDTKLIEVYTNQPEQLLGYLILDLHPRPHKFSHAAKFGIMEPIIKADGTRRPAIAVVVANFPKPTVDRPSLLTFSDVKTFFHEFGHAIHTFFGATTMEGFAGTQVKKDFVEMPSQMLEEWLYDKEILHMIAHHYQTGESLSDAIIEKLNELKKFDGAFWITSQSYYALLALEYFKPGGEKDTTMLAHQLAQEIISYVRVDTRTHFQTSFGHLLGYGPLYYGYIWSKVFALDLFNHIKQYGLLNPNIGKKYAQTILAKGGSIDPNILLKDFLGREPSQKAFLKDLGL